MKAQDYPHAVKELITQLKRMPGIGSRGAERLALWFLQQGRQEATHLADALTQSNEQVGYCPQCGFFALKGELCTACQTPERAQNQICIVEQPTDVLPIERCGIYRGLYHCLGGKISPLDGVMPEDLAIEGLLARIKKQAEQAQAEIILALGSDVEGEATALYLADLLEKQHCRVTRLAQGMPAGAGLGHADAVTLMRAFEGRKHFSASGSEEN